MYWMFLFFFTLPYSPVDVELNYPSQYSYEVGRWYPLVEYVLDVYDLEDELSTFMRVLHCESRGDPNAVNPSSGTTGLMQHMPRYWPERAAKAGFSGWPAHNPVVNIYASAWLLKLPDIGGWKHWECY